MTQNVQHPRLLDSIKQRSLIIGAVAMLACLVWVFINRGQFFQSYLLGYMLWVGMTLGCFAILMLHHLVGGSWGFAIQRSLEAGTRTFPLMFLLFLPILLGLPDLYLWARPDEVAHDELLQHKSIYLNVPFFILRAVIYFVGWIGVAYLLNRWSLAQDEATSAPPLAERLKLCSGFGLAFYGGTITLASVDWVMSLEPHWFSTVYGVLFIVGQALTTIALMIVVLALLASHKPLSDFVRSQHFQDLGNLMLAFVMLWAYIAFSQYLIIWSGNLVEEAHWYVHRTDGGWKVIVGVLMVFHFFLPFLLLLSRRTKRQVRFIAILAGMMIVMRLVDLFWLIAPVFHHEGVYVHLLDVLAPLGIGGFWVATFVWQLQKRPLLPLNDPRLATVQVHGTEANHA